MSDFFATPWTEARQAPPSMGFFKQEYWNGLPFPSPGDLPDPGIKPASPAWQADSLPSELPGKLPRCVVQSNADKVPASSGSWPFSFERPLSGTMATAYNLIQPGQVTVVGM